MRGVSMPAPDAAFYLKQAEQCRRLARTAQAREARILQDMADEYEAKARELGA